MARRESFHPPEFGLGPEPSVDLAQCLWPYILVPELIGACGGMELASTGLRRAVMAGITLSPPGSQSCARK